MKKLFISLLLLLVSSGLFAQNLTNAQRRRLNLLSVELLEDYELYSRLSDKSARYNFKKLFSSPTDMIFCDLYNDGSNFHSQVPVSEYVDFVQGNCESIDVRISRIKRGDLTYNNGRWYYILTFEKQVSFNDKNGVLFPVYEDEAEPFKLEMLIEFDSMADNPLICEIRPQSNIRYDKLDKMLIVQKAEDRKNLKQEVKLTSNGSPIIYNSFGQAMVRSLDFMHPDEDVNVWWDYLATESAYDLIQLKYATNRLRIKLRNEVAPLAYVPIEAHTGMKTRSFGYSIGFDIGVTFPITNITKGGFYAGVGVVYSTFKTTADSFTEYAYSFTNSLGLMRNLQYDISKISQRVSFIDLAYPFYFNVETKVRQNVYLIADLGLKFYMNNSYKVTSPRAVFVKTDQDNYELLEDGTTKPISEKKKATYAGETIITRPDYETSFFFNIGADVELAENLLYLEAKVGYERGRGEVSCKNFDSVIDYERPIIYSETVDRDVLLAPVLGHSKWVRNAIWINVGLKLKF